MERCVGGAVDGFNSRFPRAVLAGFAVEGDFDLAVETIVEQLPILVAGFYLPAADRDQVIANFHLHPVFVGWTIFINMTDAIATRGRIWFEIDSQIAGRNPTSCASTR